MATSTLVQFLGDGITTPTGAGADTSNRRQVETFISSGAIAKGDWVELDASKTGADRALYVKECVGVGTKGNAAAFGVALAAVAAAGEQVRIVVAGYVEEARLQVQPLRAVPSSVPSAPQAAQKSRCPAPRPVACAVSPSRPMPPTSRRSSSSRSTEPPPRVTAPSCPLGPVTLPHRLPARAGGAPFHESKDSP